jgi:hypothetical protein
MVARARQAGAGQRGSSRDSGAHAWAHSQQNVTGEVSTVHPPLNLMTRYSKPTVMKPSSWDCSWMAHGASADTLSRLSLSADAARCR